MLGTGNRTIANLEIEASRTIIEHNGISDRTPCSIDRFAKEEQSISLIPFCPNQERAT